ncbi:chemotaxis protein CheB [Amycolatopsis sp. CA-126428]|uniref:chemotaxis protein CheB n=1 Tax=Amycolatopsis sp. CA-126428 TaxID=2073158 RepID=UPI001E493D97|nr:chemotaxis protein CheB [Amycolatopsis sp. CA-126428]
MFAQDEGTSAHFGMPGAAIGTGLVHAVLPLSGIGAAILDHVGPVRLRPSGGRAQFNTVQRGYSPWRTASATVEPKVRRWTPCRLSGFPA